MFIIVLLALTPVGGERHDKEAMRLSEMTA
jgi:hypothetical protein